MSVLFLQSSATPLNFAVVLMGLSYFTLCMSVIFPLVRAEKVSLPVTQSNPASRPSSFECQQPGPAHTTPPRPYFISTAPYSALYTSEKIENLAVISLDKQSLLKGSFSFSRSFTNTQTFNHSWSPNLGF